MTPLAVLLVALVADDGVTLRGSPYDGAPAQATLFRGDWLEVRGEVPGFLKVWDHRHERPGYVRPASVRVHKADETSAEELRAVVRFLKDAAGHESLGIGYAALYLRVAAPARRGQGEWAEVLGALGTMADRLARRASGGTVGPSRGGGDSVLAGQLGVSESYGVRMRRFVRSGVGDARRGESTVVCYDGDAFARVLGLSAAAAKEKATAALALTRRGCLDPTISASERRTWNEARLTVLGEANPAAAGFADLARPLAHRLRLRTAEVLAEQAHAEAAAGRGVLAARAAAEALRLIALVDRGELAPEDRSSYEESAVRVAAMRPLLEVPEPHSRQRPVQVEIAAGRAGETCVRLWPTHGKDPAAPLASRCTYGVVFGGSVKLAANGAAVTVAVAPLAAWTELWIFRTDKPDARWRTDVIPPALGQPGDDIGYVEVAGFTPDGMRVLVAREFRAGGRWGKRFELLAHDGGIPHAASSPDRLIAFRRWAAPAWRRTTLLTR